MKRSLRLRLLIGTSVAMAVVLTLLGLAIYFSMWRSLLWEFDGGLLTQAKALGGMVEQHGQRLKFEFDAQQMPEFNSGRRAEYFEIRFDGGKVLVRSNSLGNGDLAAGISTRDVILPDGRRGRSLSIRFSARVDHDDDEEGDGAAAQSLELTVARDTADLDQTLLRLRWLLVGLCAGAIVVSGAALIFVVGRAVRPVNRLAAEIGALRETDLGRRLDLPDVPAELAPVVQRLNGLLGRLENAFGRERAFTADVAHELRTPLAGLTTTLEVCRSRPRDNPAYEAAIDKCRKMIDRMQAMVESLLLLARADGGQLAAVQRRVDLSLLLSECWAVCQVRAEQRGVVVGWEVPSGCIVESDADKLRIVFQNLLDNAVSYVDDGGTIRVVVDAEAVEISNSGSGVGSEELPHLFERFWRGDQARTDTGVHCGLGLSLCRRLMELLGGQISVNAVRGGSFVVRCAVPGIQIS
jgi:two-component system, OmpR family, heavy metal sensor histidine kinase CusS